MKNRLFWRIRMLPLWVTAALLLVASVPGISLAQEPIPVPDASQIQPRVTKGGIYTNTWAVQVSDGTDAQAVAASLGMEYLYPVGSLRSWHLFRAPNVTGVAASQTSALLNTAGVVQAVQQVTQSLSTRAPTDPEFPKQWHLNNTGQSGGTAGNDANVVAAWDLGYTGEGVVVASVDNGVWLAHPDLAPNIRADLSYDFDSNDADPSGGDHGTAVAGVMAAAANASPHVPDHCGVGSAYDAEIAGLKMLGTYTDAVIGAALSYKPDDIHIYNSSWGPIDYGSVLEGPGPLSAAALQNGILDGRGGLGSIYVWAAGNGKLYNDNINADGYANSLYVIAVGASTNEGVSAWYSEPGAPMLVTAPSNGGTGSFMTTGAAATGCLESFGGTSAAAPLAAGVIALMLEANPNLTWRDVKHILVETAEKIDPADPDWQTNAAGHEFNHYHGFGRIDAGAAVVAAVGWDTVPPMISYTSPVTEVNTTIPEDAGAPLTSVINVPENFVVEQVEIVISAVHPWRGQMHINLTSPGGTTSRMIFGRPDQGDYYSNWKMSTVASWGEESAGDWTLSVWDRIADDNNGTFEDWQLIVWGYQAEIEPTLTPTSTSTDEIALQTPTPTATEDIPVETLTATATATITTTATTTEGTPVETPTATPTTVAGTELLANGGFESDLTGWTAKNLTKDRVVTNKPEKIFAHTGEKAFRFKGVPGENAKIQQKPDASTLVAGDTLILSAWVQTNVAVPGKVVMAKIIYSDDTRTKLELELNAPAESYTIFDASTLLSNTLSKLKVQVFYKGTSGKVLIDDVSLIQTVGAGLSRSLPLP